MACRNSKSMLTTERSHFTKTKCYEIPITHTRKGKRDNKMLNDWQGFKVKDRKPIEHRGQVKHFIFCGILMVNACHCTFFKIHRMYKIKSESSF